MKQKPTYEEWLKTVPKGKRDTTTYNLRRAYELAPYEDMVAFAREEGAHLYSAYENPETGEYEFMKRKDHPTIQEELNWYYSEGGRDFRERYDLDTSGDYYKYVPKKSLIDEALKRRKNL